MKRFVFVLAGIFLALSASVKADEGMWLLPLIKKLNIDTMQAMGLKLSAEDIYSINNSSVKDAIVIFGGGCTGEIVSDEGLLLTNHHCGYDAIQNHSTVEHNYLEDGFWAMEKTEELPNPDLRVTFLVRVEDVTETVLSKIGNAQSEEKRGELLKAVSDSISKAATEGTHYRADVESLFGGNNFYLFVYEVFSDVRLVGAPPSSIGKFGHDTDNWMWPRHTGDFSIFRVYAAPDGKPASYSKENVPLKPKHSLPVSLKERNLNDFAMVMGYPGTTTRYMTSYEIQELTTITNPNRIKIRGLRQDILLKDMRADEKVNIQYASKYSGSSNYWKYSIGQNQGLKRLRILEKKQQQEADFTKWVNAEAQQKEKYGNALELISNAITKRAESAHTLQYTYECFFSSSELIAFANRVNGLYNVLQREPENKALIDSLANMLKSRWESFYKEYNPATDMKVIPAMLKLYRENVRAEALPGIYKIIDTKFKGDYDKYTADMFAKSIFASREKMDAFVANPSKKVLDKDPAFQAASSAIEVYRAAYFNESSADSDFEKGHRLYIAGLQEMQPEKTFYPDANFTMRLTYGTVQDYKARDAVEYGYYTTIDGIMEKEDPDNWEFVVPDKLKTLYKQKDYGEYAMKDGRMPVCFITNNDITGGNSGSPVIDGEGSLIGLAFDGNWEAMSSNIAFEPDLQRCICVDIRYVLFIIDKYAGASHLIKEMKIIR
ncbi:MAG: S46 family peptidase [Bacteroidales bacterium]|nr:S46 family peptidase [Bacteroidales bacterium]